MLDEPPRGQGTLMLEDLDPAETREWVEALDSVLAFEGADRAFYLLDEVTAGGRRRRPVLVPAPVADAGLLADAHGVDGPGPDHGHLPGAVPEVPGVPRAGRHR